MERPVNASTRCRGRCTMTYSVCVSSAPPSQGRPKPRELTSRMANDYTPLVAEVLASRSSGPRRSVNHFMNQSIVILGGGFGGVYTARHLNRLLRRRDDVEVVLVSRHNYFLMTPLLFEAGSGVLEPRHAVSPIRKLFRRRTSRVRFIQAEVRSVDFERKVVIAQPPGDEETHDISYSHLVIALGGVTNIAVIPGAERAMTFKVLADAMFLRNHCIELF